MLTERLQCSELEARSLKPRGLAFAEKLVALTKAYSVEHYDLSWKIKDELDAFPREPDGVLQKLRHKATLARLRAKISGDLKAMWVTAVEARRIEQELFYALEVYDLPIDPRTFITTLLKAMNEQGDLPDPKAVSDGREIYENLAFKDGVLRAFNLRPAVHDTITSRYYRTYERAFR